MSEFSTQPENQPERCPSIDPHDTLQCGRRVHDDDQCQLGGIGWRKGTPRYVSDSERVADLESRLACVVEATYWDRPYDVRIAAIRGMCDLTTNGMTPAALDGTTP